MGPSAAKFSEEYKPVNKGPRFLARDVKNGKGDDTSGTIYNRGTLDLEGNNDSSNTTAVSQEFHERKSMTKRADMMKNIETMLNEVGTIFQRLGTMVKMHEVMIDR